MNKHDPPFVSFVIPTRNEELNIGGCIKAINSLEYDKDKYEIIVVDGLSEDRTCDIAKSLGIKVITNQKVIQSAARNLGASEAKGELIAFIDADVILDPSWLIRGISNLKNPKVAAVGSFPGVADDSSWIEKTWFFYLSSKYPQELKVEVTWLDSACLLFRKEVFQKIGGFNESVIYSEDVDLGYKAKEQESILLYDPSLKSIHLGYEKTIYGFVKRNYAGGRVIFQLIRNHGFVKNISITFFIGFYLVCLIVAVFGLITNMKLSLIALMLIILFSLGVALKRSYQAKLYNYTIPLILLLIISGITRAFALLIPSNK